MKKTLCLIFVLIFAFSALSVTSFAEDKTANLAAVFNSDIAGMTEADYEKMADLSVGNLVFHEEGVFICDYSNQANEGAIVAGRTYFIYYYFDTADGYEFPEDIGSNLNFTCEGNTEVVSYSLINGGVPVGGEFLTICVEVKVDGNIFQKIIGFFTDMILKLKLWSLY